MSKRRKMNAARRRELVGVAATPRRPSLQELRTKVATLDQYAGTPMPVEEAPLVLARRHPRFESLNGCCLDPERDQRDKAKLEKENAGLSLRNSWWSWKRRQIVYLMDDATSGKVEAGISRKGPMQSLTTQLYTLGIAQTMRFEAELRAQKLLGELLVAGPNGPGSGKNRLNGYLIAGSFLETSRRSGVTYMFRRLATTLAFRNGESGLRFLAALCLHPLAYYDGLPISTMVPTDDVIAHLTMMRADEHLFWRKANQHEATSPGAQLG